MTILRIERIIGGCEPREWTARTVEAVRLDQQMPDPELQARVNLFSWLARFRKQETDNLTSSNFKLADAPTTVMVAAKASKHRSLLAQWEAGRALPLHLGLNGRLARQPLLHSVS